MDQAEKTSNKKLENFCHYFLPWLLQITPKYSNLTLCHWVSKDALSRKVWVNSWK